MSKQLPPLPHQTILRTLHSEELPEPPYTVYGFTSEQLQAYATAVTEPLLQRIAELEDSLSAWRRNAELADQANRELERQLHEQAVSLEEARNQALEEAAEKLEKQHHWITNVASANIVRALKGAKK